MNFLPLPVLMIGTYDKDGKANVMNAAKMLLKFLMRKHCFNFNWWYYSIKKGSKRGPSIGIEGGIKNNFE